jgi:hypothetical protein
VADLTPDALAAAAARDCSLCHVPLATGDCPHGIRANGQVTMSEAAWERLVSELADLRTREAAREDGDEITGDPTPGPDTCTHPRAHDSTQLGGPLTARCVDCQTEVPVDEPPLTPATLAAAAADDLARHQQQRTARIRKAAVTYGHYWGTADTEDGMVLSGAPYDLVHDPGFAAAIDTTGPDGWESVDALADAYRQTLADLERAEAEIERLRKPPITIHYDKPPNQTPGYAAGLRDGYQEGRRHGPDHA